MTDKTNCDKSSSVENFVIPASPGWQIVCYGDTGERGKEPIIAWRMKIVDDKTFTFPLTVEGDVESNEDLYAIFNSKSQEWRLPATHQAGLGITALQKAVATHLAE